MARIPTGQTGVRPRVPTPAPQPAVKEAAPAREGTRMHQRRGSGSREGQRPVIKRKGGNTGLILGLAIAAVAVIAVLAVMMLKKPGDQPVVKKKSTPVVAPAPEPEPPPAAPTPAPEPPKPTPEQLKLAGAEDAKVADWDNIMSYLRTGGALDDPDRGEGFYFARIKKMGSAAYPYLIKYIEHEELPMARAAVTVLNALTGQNKPIPNATSSRAQVKAEWEAWVKANP
jgi:hypothetical protein